MQHSSNFKLALYKDVMWGSRVLFRGYILRNCCRGRSMQKYDWQTCLRLGRKPRHSKLNKVLNSPCCKKLLFQQHAGSSIFSTSWDLFYCFGDKQYRYHTNKCKKKKKKVPTIAITTEPLRCGRNSTEKEGARIFSRRVLRPRLAMKMSVEKRSGWLSRLLPMPNDVMGTCRVTEAWQPNFQTKLGKTETNKQFKEKQLKEKD